MKNLKFNVSNFLFNVVSCLVVEKENTIQIVKNRHGNLKFDDVKDLDFVKITRENVGDYNDIINMYSGKNIWYLIT